MVFLSWAGAGDRGRARAAEWSQRLNRAGFDVIDHPTWAGYDQILADIARSDAVIAAVSQLGGTWAATEQTSAAEGRDTFDGSRPSSSPRPTYFWFVDPTWVDPPATDPCSRTSRAFSIEVARPDYPMTSMMRSALPWS